MHADRCRRLVDAPGPFISIYLDLSRRLAAVGREVAEEFTRRRHAVMTDAAQRFGAATVVADHDQLLLAGPDAETVSALGGSPDRVLPADEVLPLLAVATGAEMVRAEAELALTDGIAAVLRYADTGQR